MAMVDVVGGGARHGTRSFIPAPASPVQNRGADRIVGSHLISTDDVGYQLAPFSDRTPAGSRGDICSGSVEIHSSMLFLTHNTLHPALGWSEV